MLFCYLTSPISVALCPILTDPANGMVTWTGLTPGSTATYTCDEGFELNGVQNRTCQSDGAWSDVPPTCDRTLPCYRNDSQQLFLPQLDTLMS